MGKTLEKGMRESFGKTITVYDVYSFAGITGDFNKVHVNEQEAEKSAFGKPIAHGMLTGSLISTVLGTKLPGPGTIYMEQDLKFKKPVFFGDTVTAVVEVEDIINEKKGIYRLSTKIINQNDDIVTDGYAVVMWRGEE